MDHFLESWWEVYQAAVQTRFAGRIWFLGLQGSYARGEATAESDIDPVLILDRVDTADLLAYSQLLDQLPEREKCCGFCAGKEELLHWEPWDLFQLYYDTKPILGTLEPLLERIGLKDVEQAVHLSACNLYHLCAHNLIHEKEESILRQGYKAAVFALSAVDYLRQGSYCSEKQQLRNRLEGLDRELLEEAIVLRQKGALSHEEWIRLSDLLLRWASNRICLEVESGTPLIEKPV